MTQLLYRVPEAAAMLRISRSALYELIRSRQICSVTVGRSRLISHNALAEFVQRLEDKAA